MSTELESIVFVFKECLNNLDTRNAVPLSDICRAVNYWQNHEDDGVSEWEGGFIVQMAAHVGGYIYLTGWCCSSGGWQCCADADFVYGDTLDDLGLPDDVRWIEECDALNAWIVSQQ